MYKLLFLALLLATFSVAAIDKITINYKGQKAEVVPGTVLLKLKKTRSKLSANKRINTVFRDILRVKNLDRNLRNTTLVNSDKHTIYKSDYPGLDIENFVKDAARHPEIESIQPNFVYRTQEIYGHDDGIKDRGARWNMQSLYIPQAHQLLNQIGGWNPNITIAILDTGIYPHHPAFDNIYNPYSIYYVIFYFGAEVYTSTDEYDAPIMGMKLDPMTGEVVSYTVTGGYHDWQGHGTHCAGMAAGNYVTNKDFNGVAPGYNIIPIKVLDDVGEGSTAVIIQGAMHALEQGADVFSLSLGGMMNDAYAELVYRDEVHARGIPIVAAAGNTYEQGNSYSYPAAYDSTIAVAALGSDDLVAYYSQSHDWVDIAAPGGDGKRKNKSGRQRQIFSTWTADPRANPKPFVTPPEPGEDRRYYAGITGTSMATPQVAGIVALLRGLDYSLTPEEIRAILKGTGSAVTGAYHPKQLQKMPGLTKANAYNAINFLLSLYQSGGAEVDTSWSEVHFEVDPSFPKGRLFINRAKLQAGTEDFDLNLDGASKMDVTNLPSNHEIFLLGNSFPPGGDKSILKLYFSGTGYIPDKSIYLNNLSSMGYIIHKSYNYPKFTIMIKADQDKKVFTVQIKNN